MLQEQNQEQTNDQPVVQDGPQYIRDLVQKGRRQHTGHDAHEHWQKNTGGDKPRPYNTDLEF
ncbi:MAG: hypothetical protein JRI95_07560 [Deltaproteobacteria bacterium]|nr:hypothetical protein [Deltaproteobacteria bacterium]MBW2086913.1 hypothetical protein [Deltaproteobacteria bacterium]